MKLDWLTTLSSGVLALILHFVLGALLVFSFDFSPKPKAQSRKDVNVVEAVAIDKKQVEIELARIKKIEDDKHKEENKRLDDLEKEASALKKERKKEEERLAETKKKKADEEKKRKEEQTKIAKLKKEKTELEEKWKIEEQKVKEAEEKRKIEEQKVKEAEEKRKIEEQRKIEEAKKLKAEEQRKRDAAEKKRLEDELRAGMEAEEKAEQTKKDQALINSIGTRIKRSIESNFNTTGLASGLECVLRVRLIPGGKVLSVSIHESSGNEIFDNRAVTATQKASPLPVPDDVATFERLDLREMTIRFRPTN